MVEHRYNPFNIECYCGDEYSPDLEGGCPSCRAIYDKWSETGLLDDLETEAMKQSVAFLLENQLRHMEGNEDE